VHRKICQLQLTLVLDRYHREMVLRNTLGYYFHRMLSDHSHIILQRVAYGIFLSVLDPVGLLPTRNVNSDICTPPPLGGKDPHS